MKVHSIAGNELHITTDLGIFKDLENNRDTESVRIKSISKSVEKIGWVMVPIVCNENMEVVDGQGRLQVAKELHLPVAYVVVRGIGIHECQTMNTTMSNWTQYDFIKSHAGCGNESFVRLMKLIDEFGATFTRSSVICAATKQKTATEKIREGTLEITYEDYLDARAFLYEMATCAKSIRKMKGRTDVVILGLRFALGVENVDASRIVEVINMNNQEIRSETLQYFLRDLQTFYNKRLSKANRIYFETEYLKSA